MTPGPRSGRLPGHTQSEPKKKRRSAAFQQRREPVHRAPIHLSRASNLGHRVIQREDAKPELTDEQKLRWQMFLKSLDTWNRVDKLDLHVQAIKLLLEASELHKLYEKAKQTRSKELTEKLVTESARLLDRTKEQRARKQRLKVALEATQKLKQWLSTRQKRNRPKDRLSLADADPGELYDQFYRDILLAKPLSGSLEDLTDELRTHFLYVRDLEPNSMEGVQLDAYLERIEQLTQAMRRLGVTAEDDTLYDLVTRNRHTPASKLFNDCRIRRSPPGTLTFGERITFQVEPYYLPPGSKVEAEWFWCPLGSKDERFIGKPRTRSPKRTFTLDESFWRRLPREVEVQKGIQLVAHLYLDGKFVRSLDSEWVPLQDKMRQGLLDRVRVMVQPRRTIPGAKVSCRLSHWSPAGPGYEIGWVVNGEEVKRGPRRTLEPIAGSPGFCQVAARIYHRVKRKWTLIHTTPKTLVTISTHADLGREVVDAFAQQKLPRFSKVRQGIEKTTTALEEKVATEGHNSPHLQQRLKAQKGRLEFLDREVPEHAAVKPLDDLTQPAQGSRYSSPVPAVLLHPEISGPVPLTLYLIVHYRDKGQWEAKLLDLTSDIPQKHEGSGTTRQAATQAALLLWQTRNPYPKGGTVSFRAAGRDGAEHFSTDNWEKTAKEWFDTVLLVGGLTLLAVPEFTGSKAFGTALVLAALARGSYAIYENLTLGVPWYDTRNVLEGLGILGSVAGLGGGVLRSLGAGASRAGIYRAGNALVLFGLGTDVTGVVVVTYEGLAMIRAIQDDPTLDDGQKASQLMRITSMLVLNGVMTFASNRDLFTSPRGSLAGRALAPGEGGALSSKTRNALELEVKRRGQGQQLKAKDGTPISDRELFEIFCQVRADERRLTDVQAELRSDRARREFGRLTRSKRRLEPVDAATRVRLSRALEVPVHQSSKLDAGSVRVSYKMERGRIRKVVMHCGPGTSVDDILRHAPAVQLLKRYRGMVGRFRGRFDRLSRFFGRNKGPTPTDGLAFEAWGELLKLPGMIAARRQRLVGRDLEAKDRARLEGEIENLRRQLETHLPRVESFARGRGYIASESANELPSHKQTVEQRWRLGETIPTYVLAAPDHYLYNLKTQSWDPRSTPYLGTGRIQAPYGKDSNFQFSWEKETQWKEENSRRIYLFYRPKKLTDQEWFKSALLQGNTFEDLAKLLREGRLNDLENVIDLTKLSAKLKKEKASAPDLTKTSLAHPKMSDEIMTIPGGFEFTHRGYEEDFNRLYGKQGQLQWTIQMFGNRAFHVHVSFPRPTREADVDDLLTLVTHLNNYAALKSYGPKDGILIGHGDIGVFGAEQRNELRAILLGERGNLKEIDTYFKRLFIGVRYGPYPDTDRIGIEFRSFGENVGAPTRSRILSTLRTLRAPRNRFAIGGQQRYTLKQLRQPGLTPSRSALEEALPPKLFEFLEGAASLARQLPGATMHPGYRPSQTKEPMGKFVKQRQLLVRWSVPFVKWETHPAVPVGAHTTIKDARDLLIRRLWVIQKQGKPTKETQHAIHKAIAKWANTTRLGEYF